MGRLSLIAALLTLPLYGATVTIDLGSGADEQFCTGGYSFTIITPGASGDLTVRAGPFSCSIPVPTGLHSVTLGIRETGTVSAVGKRSFGVKINDQSVLEKFDLFAVAGLQETERAFVVISTGVIRIDATHTPGTGKTAIVSWLRIEPISSGTGVNYIKPQDPKREQIVDAVAYRGTGSLNWIVPRPSSETNPTVSLLYTNVRVWRNGQKERPDLVAITKNGLFLEVNAKWDVPIQWALTDSILVDYIATWPLAADQFGTPIAFDRYTCVGLGPSWNCADLELFHFLLADGSRRGPYIGIKAGPSELIAPIWKRQPGF